MDSRQHQKIREKVVDKQHEDRKSKKEGKEGLTAAAISKQQSPTSPASATSPPSASSSPSHEFSFTISLHSSSSTVPDKTNNAPPSFAVDLAPADDIFFHGHLLPLHLLSHLPVSPRSSTNSLDSFTLPARDFLDDQNLSKDSSNYSTSNRTTNKSEDLQSSNTETKGRIKSKSFSLFGLTRWRKGCEVREKEDKEKKRKLRFDVSHVLKRYVRLVRPLFIFRRRGENIQLRRQPYSFSGNLRMKNKQWLRGRRGEFSAPASMRTSPTNSGLLVATATLPSSTSDSTMEELQAAIQAAIAHCKNSIAKEEKIICYD
ncbi:BRI1 kinase inhibitor 1 [Corylus avellana]|uniref:BRI1 kinase inhibitor 1 n=1 Tax=Corylus avellana TaxID=13451 RepID=UPI001E23604A|nr:BRI1 kinase inhibitor 1 [Corylus avellana]